MTARLFFFAGFFLLLVAVSLFRAPQKIFASCSCFDGFTSDHCPLPARCGCGGNSCTAFSACGTAVGELQSDRVCTCDSQQEARDAACGGGTIIQPPTCDHSYCTGCHKWSQCSVLGSQSECEFHSCSWSNKSGCSGGQYCEGTCAENNNGGDCQKWGCTWVSNIGSNSVCASGCSATCGGGTCTSQCGNSISCNTQPCCNANDWGVWSTCTKSCGGGTQTRTNACGTAQSQSCNTQACVIPGDLNNDGKVDILDLRKIIATFTTIFDYNLVVANYGK